MNKLYIIVSLLLAIILIALFGVRYVNQRNNAPTTSPAITNPTVTPVATALGCTRTTGKIDTNVIGIGTPANGHVKGDQEALIDLNVKWLRDGVRWTYLEPTEGVYSWQEQDAVVNFASQNNINMLLDTVDVPDWVWKKNRQGRIDAIYTLYKNLATRYKGKVRYYEAFNEPNLPGLGFYPENKSERDADYVSTYLDFLAAANKAIHEVDANAVVALGGLSPSGMSPAIFMKQLYELGGKDCFDVLDYHPYDSLGTQGAFKAKAEAIRKFMTSSGDYTDKPIWFGELGSNTPEDQIKFMNQMKNELSAAPAWFWFSFRDFTSNSENGSFGLLTEGGQKKPAYDLFKQMVQLKK